LHASRPDELVERDQTANPVRVRRRPQTPRHYIVIDYQPLVRRPDACPAFGPCVEHTPRDQDAERLSHDRAADAVLFRQCDLRGKVVIVWILVDDAGYELVHYLFNQRRVVVVTHVDFRPK
jgi:hypothetical protein